VTLAVLIVLFLAAFVAYANGSNDVSKGIATLAGSGVTSYRRAILWGTLWTGLGGFAGAIVAGAMVATFGTGLLARGASPSFAAAVATIVGAAAWVALATRTGLPVSTTHAIVGSVAGVGSVAYGLAGVQWASLGTKIGLPLLLSPIVAFAMTSLVLRGWTVLSQRSRSEAQCLCAEFETAPALMGMGSDGTSALTATFNPVLELTIGSQQGCAIDRPAALRLTINHLHWLTSGATAFSRGMNDSPKMVALVLAAMALLGVGPNIRLVAFTLVALGMVAGSWIAGRRVTTVLAEKVTSMDHREGFVANLVTAALVGPGAALGLPMSTTHVSSGAIIAVGAQSRAGLNWETVRDLMLAWVVTLPGAALLGIVAYQLLRLSRLA
jgi:inorganic phosphate transporter, PiT family